MQGHSLPEELKEEVIVKIPNKGDLTEKDNQRAITLLSMVSKIIAYIITIRLSHKLAPDLRTEQAGLRPNKSCVDHINSLRIFVKQSVEWRSTLYLALLDFEKAFDTLPHEVAWSFLVCK